MTAGPNARSAALLVGSIPWALRAIKIFDLDCSQIHHDTTTVTFVGKYGGWNASEQLAYGKNKDHRPDLKQLVLGLNVTADGAVPSSHQIYDGYHLHWIRSTQKAQQDAETRERRIEHALKSILAKGYCQKLIRYEIQVIRHCKRIYEKKGLPQKGDTYRTVGSQNSTLTFDVGKDEVEGHNESSPICTSISWR